MGELGGDNVRYNKLLHEFKVLYPKVPDEIVRRCVKHFGNDKQRCNDVLAAESERSAVPHGPAYNRVQPDNRRGGQPDVPDATGQQRPGSAGLVPGPGSRRRLSLANPALLNQQMQRQLMLRDEYNREYRMLDDLRTDVNHLESSIQLRQIHIRDELMALEAAVAAGEQAGQKNTHEAAIVGLEDSCSRLEDKLEQLTRVRDNKRKADPSPSQIPAKSDLRLPGLAKSGGGGGGSDETGLVAGLASVLESVAGTVLPAGATISSAAREGGEREEEEEEEQQWPCSACTYLNHPLLKDCEQCSMPRIMVGTAPEHLHRDQPCFCHPQSAAASTTASEVKPVGELTPDQGSESAVSAESKKPVDSIESVPAAAAAVAVKGLEEAPAPSQTACDSASNQAC